MRFGKFTRTVISVALSAAFLCGITGPVSVSAATASGNYYYYNLLNGKQRAFWDKLEKKCSAIYKSKKDLKGDELTFKLSEIDKLPSYGKGKNRVTGSMFVYELFIDSNPQYFFLKRSEKRSVYLLELGIEPAYLKGAVRKKAAASIKKTADQWVKAVAGKSSDSEKVRYLYDKLIAKASYKTGAKDSQNIASVFLKGPTVCNGYALSMNYLLNEAGIPAIVVHSYNHSWNKVRIDSNWYNLDPTWDDLQGSGHKWFMVSDSKTKANDQDSYHVLNGYLKDLVPKAKYDKLKTASSRVGKPAIKIASFKSDKVTLKIESSTDGAVFYCTKNGKTPDISSVKAAKTTGPYTVDLKDLRKIKVIAVRDGMKDSEVAVYGE